MRAPRAHTVVLVVLAAIGLGAVGVGWYCVTRAQVLSSTHEVAAAKIDALVERASRLDASFESFESRGIDHSWFTATSRLVEDLHARAAELDSALPGVAMAPRARLAEDLQRVRETVNGARANLEAGRTLMALDVMQSDGRPASAAVGAELPALRAAVAGEIDALQQRWWQRAAGSGGAWAVAWAIGLLWFARRRVPAESVEERTALFGLSPLGESGAVEAAAPAPPAGQPPVQALDEVADVCERIGRVRDASELPDLLEEAAAVLHADGLVLWTRDADGLVVGAAHGYPDNVAQRLGRVPLADENLITRAWHSGRCRTSAADADAGRRAAFAAPLVGTTGPVGVLAAELSSEADFGSVVARARLVAAQFAAVLGETGAGTREDAGDPPPVTPPQFEATGS
jgi:hypothetical protein